MSKITEINKFHMKAEVECDCGTKFIWEETNDPKKVRLLKDECPKCHIKYGMVFAPKKLNVPASKVDDFMKNTMGGYV